MENLAEPIVRVAFLAIGFAFGAILVIITMIPEWSASWVQAIGSVAAIIVAVVIATFERHRTEKLTKIQQQRDNKDRQIKARSLAIAIYPEMLEVKAKFRGNKDSTSQVMPIKIDIPPVLLDATYQFYFLEDAGAQLQQFVAVTRQFNRMVAESRSKPKADGSFRVTPEKRKGLNNHLATAETLLHEALDLIGPIHDGE